MRSDGNDFMVVKMKTRRYVITDKETLGLQRQCKTKPKYIIRASFKKDNEE